MRKTLPPIILIFALSGCASREIIELRRDGRMYQVSKPGVPTATVNESDFLSRMKSALNITVEYTLAGDNQPMLDVVNAEDPSAIARKRNEANRVFEDLREFIDSYDGTSLAPKQAEHFRERISLLRPRVADDKTLNSAIDDGNALIFEVVEAAMKNLKHTKRVTPTGRPRFEYHVLSAYLRPPKIHAEFVSIGDAEIQTTEVTQEQWVTVMGYNRSSFKNPKICPKGYRQIYGLKLCADHPVENVAWEDAQTFIRRLNEGSPDYVYRLPTDKEWERAARNGTKTRFHFGDDPRMLGEYGWYEANAGQSSMEVATRKPNALGLFDMYGNVWEWVQLESELKAAQSRSVAAASELRIIRGGGWFNPIEVQGSSTRDRVLSDYGCPGVGFRLAREARK